MRFKLIIYVLLLGLTVSIIRAQVVSIKVGINGLTCSACSYGTERAIKKLPFVKDLRMDLNNKTAQIDLIEGAPIDFDALAQKVVDAGFSVRYIKARIDFKDADIIENTIYKLDGFTIVFIDSSKNKLIGEREVTLLAKDYMSHKEYKKWKAKVHEAQMKIDKSVKTYAVTF